MHGYTPTYLKGPDDVIVGTVVDYQSDEANEKTLLFVDTPGGGVSLDPFNKALMSCLQYLGLNEPADLIGGQWKFSKRSATNGKTYFNITRHTAGASAPPAPARTSAPARASSDPVAYDAVVRDLVEKTVPFLEEKLMGNLTEQGLIAFVTRAADTIVRSRA